MDATPGVPCAFAGALPVSSRLSEPAEDNSAVAGPGEYSIAPVSSRCQRQYCAIRAVSKWTEPLLEYPCVPALVVQGVTSVLDLALRVHLVMRIEPRWTAYDRSFWGGSVRPSKSMQTLESCKVAPSTWSAPDIAWWMCSETDRVADL
eukprot:776360-Rhodomonas_salina.2